MENTKKIEKVNMVLSYVRKSGDITITRKVDFKTVDNGIDVSLSQLDGSFIHAGLLDNNSFDALLEKVNKREAVDAPFLKALNDKLSAEKIKITAYPDNCIVRAFNAYLSQLKKEDKEKAFNENNIVFKYKDKEKDYTLACVPKYAISKSGKEFIIFKGIDCNAVIAIARKYKACVTDIHTKIDDSTVEYIVCGKLTATNYNANTRNLQASKLAGLTKTILNSYFNGKSWKECYDLCSKCKEFTSITLPAPLKAYC